MTDMPKAKVTPITETLPHTFTTEHGQAFIRAYCAHKEFPLPDPLPFSATPPGIMIQPVAKMVNSFARLMNCTDLHNVEQTITEYLAQVKTRVKFGPTTAISRRSQAVVAMSNIYKFFTVPDDPILLAVQSDCRNSQVIAEQSRLQRQAEQFEKGEGKLLSIEEFDHVVESVTNKFEALWEQDHPEKYEAMLDCLAVLCAKHGLRSDPGQVTLGQRGDHPLYYDDLAGCIFLKSVVKATKDNPRVTEELSPAMVDALRKFLAENPERVYLFSDIAEFDQRKLQDAYSDCLKRNGLTINCARRVETTRSFHEAQETGDTQKFAQQAAARGHSVAAAARIYANVPKRRANGTQGGTEEEPESPKRPRTEYDYSTQTLLQLTEDLNAASASGNFELIAECSAKVSLCLAMRTIQAAAQKK
jgi:hypothetical protein